MHLRRWALVVLIALVGAGCGNDNDDNGGTADTGGDTMDDTGGGDAMDDTPDAGEDPTEDPEPDVVEDTQEDVAMDTGDDTATDTGDDTATDTGDDTGDDTDTMVQPTEETFVQPEDFVATTGGDVLVLDFEPVEVELDGNRYCTRGFNGGIPGPTVRVPASADERQIRVDLNNTFTTMDMQAVGPPGPGGVEYDFNMTNLHTHGLHVQAERSSDDLFYGDNVLIHLMAGESAEYRYDIDEHVTHEAGTFWYHPHVHGSTAIQVGGGAVGAWIIEGPVDEVAGIAEARERVMIVQHIPYSTATPLGAGEDCTEDNLSFNSFMTIAGAPEIVLNGVVAPTMVAAPGSVERWRFVHGGVTAEMTLSLRPATGDSCDNVGAAMDLNQIAADGFTFPEFWTRDGLFMAPGYRADVMVEVPDTEGLYCLMAAVPAGPGMMLDELVASLVVETAAGDATGALPSESDLAAIAAPTIDCGAAVDGTQLNIFSQQTDDMGMQCEGGPPGGLKFNINCETFEHDDPGRFVSVDTTDEWLLNSEGGGSHPFHIHINPFTVCTLDLGQEVLPFPQWRDTILVPQSDTDVRIVQEYPFYTGSFVTHCHKLHHEDQGMMQLVTIE